MLSLPNRQNELRPIPLPKGSTAVHAPVLPESLENVSIRTTRNEADYEAVRSHPGNKSRAAATMKRLNSGIAIGEVAGLSLLAGMACTAISCYQAAPSPIVLAVSAAGSLYMGARRLYFLFQEVRGGVAPSPGDRDYQRLAQCVDELAAAHKLPAPHLRVVDKSIGAMSAQILDRLTTRNTLTMSRLLCRALPERALRFIVAHELSHANRLVNKIDTARDWLRVLCYPSAFAAGAHALYAGGVFGVAQGSLLASGFIALGGYLTARTIDRLSQAFSERRNEHLTDIRAVCMTGDLSGARSGLSIVSKLYLDPLDVDHCGILDTHPDRASRIKLIEDVFLDRPEKQ